MTGRVPTRVAVPLRMPAEQARERLRAAVDANERIDPPGVSTDRRLRGEVTSNAITLWVRDGRLATRRKSWNIEFQGQLDGSGDNATLNGAIEIPDQVALRWLMRLVRVASAVPVIFAILLAASDGITRASAPVIVLAPVIAAVALVGATVMEGAGERAAADDARMLIRFIRSELA
jgi:hypothetical protein